VLVPSSADSIAIFDTQAQATSRRGIAEGCFNLDKKQQNGI